MAAFRGMRGTGNWATDQRPKNWREYILYLWPNGSAALTAMLSMAKSERTTDPEFNWWTKTLQTQSVTVTGVYTDSSLSSAYTSGGVSGDTLYVKMSAAHVSNFKIGHTVLLRDASNLDMDVRARVTNVASAGASSYIAVVLLENDDNSTTDLSDCDTALIIGSVHAEGAESPTAINYDPTKFYNYTQIFRNSLEMTRTALETNLRTGDAKKEAKREALELHSIEMEKGFIWGRKFETTGGNGKPMRGTDGLIPFIMDNSSNNFNYASDSDYSGDAWLTSGKTWLNAKLEQVFRYGDTEKMAFCGSGALLGINELAEAFGTIQMQPGETEYGIKVMKWITPFGILNLKTHPLFSYEATNRNMMVVFEPDNLRYRYITDTMYKADKSMGEGGQLGIDGIKEEWLTEAGLEFHFPETAGIFKGVGLANTM